MKSSVTSLSMMIPVVGILLGIFNCVQGQDVDLPKSQPKITIMSAVRVRTGPQTLAQEITRLKLGTVITAVARSSETSELLGKKDYWYRVSLPEDGTGWIFGGLLTDYDAERRQEILRGIIEERQKTESMSFEDAVDFYNFVIGASLDAKERVFKGELELARLHAIERAVAAIPDGQQLQSPYRDFFRSHQKEIYHHELAGGWAVRPELFWSLEATYHGTDIGDRIAWDAAQALRPGECEGDEVCKFLSLQDTEGRYLALYPRGAHAREAVQALTEALSSEQLIKTLKGKGTDRNAIEERQELVKALTELRTTISKMSSPEKSGIEKKLDELSPFIRLPDRRKA
jgi:Bacterial SH3 domain